MLAYLFLILTMVVLERFRQGRFQRNLGFASTLFALGKFTRLVDYLDSASSACI